MCRFLPIRPRFPNAWGGLSNSQLLEARPSVGFPEKVSTFTDSALRPVPGG